MLGMVVLQREHDLADELAGTLESWGIYTLEQLAQLPETGIAERFGAEGVHLQRLARGAA